VSQPAILSQPEESSRASRATSANQRPRASQASGIKKLIAFKVGFSELTVQFRQISAIDTIPPFGPFGS